MNKSILPNTRFISLPSAQLGKDWFELTLKLDSTLEALGLELSEEVTYLHFSVAPGLILDGAGECRIARSVVGPQKSLNGEFKISDWQQGFVYRFQLNAQSWDEVFAQCYEAWEKLARNNHKTSSSFTIVVKREIQEKLFLTLEAIFYEG